jgi:hypothetical protein
MVKEGAGMDWNIVLHDQDGYIEVVTGGVADAEGTVGMTQAIAQTMRSHRVTKALIDHRGVTDVIGGVSGTYNRPKLFRLLGVVLGIKIAEVIRPEHAEHFKFFELVCVNQGYNLSVFQDKDKALAWLLA